MAKQITIAAIVAICICLVTLTPQPAQGQAVYGNIVGTITDPQGAAVSGAKVTVTSSTKGTTVEVTSNPDGNYTVRVTAKSKETGESESADASVEVRSD